MPFSNPFSFIACISQKFGENPQVYSRFKMLGHNGLDFAIPENTEILACFDGTITKIGYDATGYGNHIRYRDGNGCEVICGHLNQISVSEGAQITTGQIIGLSGNTGFSTGPHLHFGMRIYKNGCVQNYCNGYFGYVDPLLYLPMYQSAETSNEVITEVPEPQDSSVKSIPMPKAHAVSDWAKDSLEFVVDAGISNGERPSDFITREEFWLTLYHFAEHLEIADTMDEDFEPIDFSKLAIDQRPSEWAEFAYLWVKENGISNAARPKEFISREEVWTTLFRMFQEDTHFAKKHMTPKTPSSSWSRLAQNWAMANNISNGEKPFDFISREEIWVMLDRLDENLSNE